MRLSASLELVWQLAAREATMGRFTEVRPEHLCMALLKFAEVPVEQIDIAANHSAAARDLAVEVEKVRKELRSRSIDSRQARRALRESVGLGEGPSGGEAPQRTPASLALMDVACRIAGDEGNEAVSPVHLLRAILNEPTEAVSRVLGDTAGPAPTDLSELPTLAESAYDLRTIAREGRLTRASGRDPEAAVLLDVLWHDDRKSVSLVVESISAGRSVILTAARTAAGVSGPAPKISSQFFDFRLYPPVRRTTEPLYAQEIGLEPLRGGQGYCTRCGAVTDPGLNEAASDETGQCCRRCKGNPMDTAERLKGALRDAASIKNAVLVVADVGMTQGGEGVDAAVDVLKSAISARCVQCVWLVTPPTYQGRLENDRDWQKLVHTMWVQSDAGLSSDVPTEL